MCLSQIGILFYFCSSLLVKFDKEFLVLQNLLQKFLTTLASPRFLAISHLLLEFFNSARLFLS